MNRAANLNADLRNAYAGAEAEHLDALVRAYEDAIIGIAVDASEKFALTAAASDWQPPADGAIITTAEVVAVATRLNASLQPIWDQIVIDTAQAPLARIEIDWTVKHPLAANLLKQAGQRTGTRLGEAVQFTLRDTLAHAYDKGLDVRATSALIQQRISGAAPFQADMLARTDLASLSNGASHAAAQLSGVGFKTWLTAGDEKVRPEHADADGQTVPLNGTFTVGGEDAAYPADPNLSDANSANCRCTLTYSDSLTAAGLRSSDERGMIPAMATKEQRRRKYERRAAHSKGIVQADTLKPNTDLVFVPSLKEMTDALTASPRAIRYNGTAAVEGKIADDNGMTPRVLMPDSLAWPEMPLPFMAQTVTAEGHDGAEIAGKVETLARKKAMGKKRNIYTEGELTNPFGINEIAPMIDDQTMRYVSADLGATEWAIVGRSDLAEVATEDLSIEDLEAGKYALGLTSGKMKGLTLLPTQALEGATIALVAAAEEEGMAIEPLTNDEMFALVASGGRWSPDPDRIFKVVTVVEEFETGEAQALVASPAPHNPPRAWFETQEPPGKMPLTISKDGRVYGHLATWDSCHVSFLPQCVPPPKSASNYAYFHVCEIDTEGGEELTVGKLMFSPDNGGHADRRLSASKASAYYDKTGMAAAYLRVVDGQHGIWACGSLNPDLTDAQREQMRRELRLNPPSGDWRPINGQYELICGLAVAVPGFPVPRAVMSLVAAGDTLELCDALIASSGMIEADPAAVAAMEHLGLVDEDAVAERKMQALAARADGLDSLA